MPELRWILIACGALLLIGVYVWGRRAARDGAASEDAALRMRPEPPMAAPEPAIEHFPGPEDTAEAAAGSSEAAYTRATDFSSTLVRATPRDPLPDVSARNAQDGGYRAAGRDFRRGRIEPTLEEAPTEEVHAATVELPVEDERPAEPAEPAQAPAPTLAMSSAPAPKRLERRKIIALRLAAGTQRFAGAQLRQTLEEENLDYGKYDVFHRLHGGAQIFSVASMVEPGTFDLEKMPTLAYPGVTLFAQLPGPVAGMEALNQLITCGKRLQEHLGGTLQDERGVPLTAHRMERLRQEIREFESQQGRDASRDAGLH